MKAAIIDNKILNIFHENALELGVPIECWVPIPDKIVSVPEEWNLYIGEAYNFLEYTESWNTERNTELILHTAKAQKKQQTENILRILDEKSVRPSRSITFALLEKTTPVLEDVNIIKDLEEKALFYREYLTIIEEAKSLLEVENIVIESLK